ncbi:MAG: metallophosphoesterase [Eubacteriales bacterium]
MREFTILHLSDLHIADINQGDLSMGITRLIKDIEEQIKEFTEVVLIISGDIVDKGMYIENKNLVIKFFKKIKDLMKDKLISIHIVPGNHDKKTNVYDDELIKSYRDTSELTNIKKDSWDYHMMPYKIFIEMINKIAEIFDNNDSIINPINYEETFGVECLNINGANICFVRANTAWCSSGKGGNTDKRKLSIGSYQLQELNSKYQKVNNNLKNNDEELDLSLFISHHPLNWLKVEEEDKLLVNLLNKDFLGSDIHVCGHIHKNSITNFYNHEKSIFTLVTGIGKDNASADDGKDLHRYSIYNINLDFNRLEIKMRQSNVAGEFKDDYTLYISDDDIKNKSLVYPIKTSSRQACIPINSYSSIDDFMFPNSKTIELISQYSCLLNSWTDRIALYREMHKRNFLIQIEETYDLDDVENAYSFYKLLVDHFFGEDETKNMDKQLKELFDKNEEYMYNDFDSYLRMICDEFINVFRQTINNNEKMRAHFRYYDKKTESYKKQCSVLSNDLNEPDLKMRDLKNSKTNLILDAYKAKKSLVYSSNKERNPLPPKDWDDFITVVPIFENYECSRGRGNQKRPYLSFGVSCCSSEDYKRLNLLSFLKIEEIVGQAIDNYLYYFPLDVKEYFENYLHTI